MAKALLKQAKQAIKDEAYPRVLELCKEILESEKNYHALVFQGLAHGKLNDVPAAEKSYQAAVQLDPAQPLAFQGLCDLYEKQQELWPADAGRARTAAEAFERLLALLPADSDKRSSTARSLAEAQLAGGLERRAVATLRQLLQQQPAADSDPLDFRRLRVSHLRACCAAVSRAWADAEQAAGAAAAAGKPRADAWARMLAKDAGLAELLTTAAAEAGSLQPASPEELQLGADALQLLDLQRRLEGRPAAQQLLPMLHQLLLGFGEAAPGAHLAAVSPAPLLTLLALFVSLGEEDSANPAGLADPLLRSPAQPLLDTHFSSSHQALALNGEHEAALSASTPTPLITPNLALAEAALESGALAKCTQHALAALERITALVAAAGDNHMWSRMEARTCCVLGRAYSREQALPQAEKYLRRALDHATRCQDVALGTSVRIALGELELARRQPDSAVTAERLGMEVLQVETSHAGALSLVGEALARQGKTEEALDKLRAAVAAEESSGLHQHRLGAALWQHVGSAAALPHLLASAKLDPSISGTFALLGKHYATAAPPNVARARRCLEKAVALDPLNTDAARQLYDMLIGAKDEAAALQLLSTITSTAGSGDARLHWAWLRLGLLQGRVGQDQEAIFSFQSAIRLNAKDADSWELLAHSYAQRGSCSAALRALQRATELNPESVQGWCQLGEIQHTLGEQVEAIAAFERSLALCSTYFPALFGLAASWAALAAAYTKEQLYGSVGERVTYALAALDRALAVSEAFACVWKLLGDVLTSTHVLPIDVVASIRVPENIARLGGAEATAARAAGDNHRALLLLGAHAFRCALGLGEQPSLWGDLALNLLHQPEPRQALICAKRALCLAQNDSALWNILGMVAMALGDATLAQHGFFKSIDLENNANAWTNLGALYVQEGQAELANRAFSQAQSLLPSLARAWVGQAMVAEKFAARETLGLFRHAFELHANPQACLGFGFWVVSETAPASERLALETFANWGGEPGFVRSPTCAIPAGYEEQYLAQAAVALAKFTNSRQGAHDPCAHNLLGVVLERQGSPRAAAAAFASAAALAAAQIERPNAAQWQRVALLNQARALTCSGQAEHVAAALQIYQQQTPSEFFDLCGYAGAAALRGDWQASYSLYEQALKALQAHGGSHPRQELEVMTAMAMVAFNSGNAPVCKDLLFRAVAVPGLCPHALFALCGLALVTKDSTLALSALAEVPKMQQLGHAMRDEHRLMYHQLTCQLLALQGSVGSAAKSLAKAVHLMPHKADCWLELAAFLSGNPAASSLEAWGTNVARSAAETGRRLSRHVQADVFAFPTSAQVVVAGAHMTAGHGLEALGQGTDSSALDTWRAAQRAVHEAPGSASAWATLATAAFVHGDLEGAERMAGVAAGLAAGLAAEGEDDKDCRLHATVLRLEARLQLALRARNTESVTALLADVVAASKEVEGDGASAAVGHWQRLAACLLSHGYDEQADLCYRQCLALLESHDPRRMAILIQLGWLAVRRQSADLAAEAVSSVLTAAPQSLTGRLLSGLAKLGKGDGSGAKKEFAKAGKAAGDGPVGQVCAALAGGNYAAASAVLLAL